MYHDPNAPDHRPEHSWKKRHPAYYEDKSPPGRPGQFAGYGDDEIQELLNPDLFPRASDRGFSDTYTHRLAAFQQVFSPQSVGKFIRPVENTWVRHKLVVQAGGLEFNPKRYQAFDKYIKQFSHLPAFDPHDRRYKQYEGLRLNLAVMRNYLLNHYFPDGEVDNDAEDRRNAKYLGQVAEELADMLRHGASWNPLAHLGSSLSLKKASVEGEGAAYMYKRLLEIQHRRNLLSPVLVPLNFLRYKSNRHWRLPPIEETPFHIRNLTAPLDVIDPNLPPDEPIGGEGPPPLDSGRADLVSHGFDTLATGLMAASVPLGDVEDLSQPVKARAIELAREILEKLRLKFGDVPVEALLDQHPADAHLLLSEADRLARIYNDHLGRAGMIDPALLQDADILLANDTLGQLAYQAKLQALKAAEEAGSGATAALLDEQIAAMPATWRDTGGTVGDMLSHVQLGFEKLLARLREREQDSDDRWARSNALIDGDSSLAAGTMALGASEGLGQGKAAYSPPPVPSQMLQQRNQQLTMASAQMSERAQERRSLQNDTGLPQSPTFPSSANAAAAAAATTASGRSSASRNSTGRSSRSGAPRPGRVAPPSMPAAPAAQPNLGSLISAGDLNGMRNSLAVPMSGEAVNPNRKRDIKNMASSKQGNGVTPLDGKGNGDAPLPEPGGRNGRPYGR